MGMIGGKEVQLGVFLDLDAQVEQLFDGSVAGQEVLGTGAEGDDLQVTEAQHGAGDRDEAGDHIGNFGSGADRIRGDVGADIPQSKVIAGI